MGLAFAALQQRLQQLCHSFSVAGIDGLRRNLSEGNQDEGALGQPGVGNLQVRFADEEIPEQQNIQIQRPGPVGDAGGPVAAKLLLDGQQPVE
jgi:hypothetical protein